MVEDIGVSDKNHLECFEEALFHVQPQYQYSAFRECNEFEEAFITNQEPDKKTLVLFHMLKRGVQNEIKLNNDYTMQKHGQKLLFGDIIQLRHVKSGKFITVIPGELARDEKENIRLSLTRDGNPYSWFQILPRFKIDHEGDNIYDENEVVFKIVERPNEYIHTSDIAPAAADKAVEVNSSLERTSWAMKTYESVLTRKLDPGVLAVSQIVFIHEPETKSNLTIFSQIDEGEEQDVDSQEEVEKPSDIVLLPMGTNVELNSNVLWVIEAISVAEGGPIMWRGQTIRLRNLNSGLYINFSHGYSGDPGTVDRKMLGDMTSGLSSAVGSELRVHDLNSSTNFLQSARAIQLAGGNYWLERLEFNDKHHVYSCRGNRRKDAAVNLLLYPYLENNIGAGGLPTVASTVTKYDQVVPFVVTKGLSVRSYLQRYYEMTVIPTNGQFADGTLWPEASRADSNKFFSDYAAIANFISANDVNEHRDAIIATRQRLFREQGTLDVLMRWLDTLVPISRMTDKTVAVDSGSPAGSPRKRKGFVQDSEEKQRFLRLGSSVLKRTLELLFFGIYNNLRNQMYVADFMPILLAHVGAQPKAAECVTEMLSKNVELQENKIGTREITIFTEKLRSSRMNSMYINLLKACCSCEGDGVDGNQCKVTDALFENINDVILQIHPNYSRLRRDPIRDSIFFLPNPDPARPTMAGRLLYEGVPELAITWTSESMMFNPIAIFGKMSEKLDVLYNNVAQANEISKTFLGSPKKGANSVVNEFKTKVASYLISQMYLAAEMCMDRNYVAIAKWDEFLTFDICTAILKLTIPDQVKAAAVRFLACSHVDRDPQTLATVPCFTRVWSDFSGAAFVSKVPCVEESRIFTFGILQQFIADHLEEIQGKQWNDLSFHTVYLLLKLVSFQFYGTEERLLATIQPLVKVIDRRNVVRSESIDIESVVSELDELAKTPVKKKISRRTIISSQSFKATPQKIASMTATSDEEDELDKGVELTGVTGRSFSFISENSSVKSEFGKGISWQKITLDILLSLPVMCGIMVLVLIGIVIAVYELLVAINFYILIANYVITAIFGIELTIRMYCYFHVHGTLFSFLRDFLNDVDILVVAVDVVIYSMPDTGSGTGFTRALRLARLIRLTRLIKAARIVTKLVEDDNTSIIAWQPPARYALAAGKEMETIVGCMEVLLQIQSLIEDRNLSLLLRGFAQWQLKKDKRNPEQIFQSVTEESSSLTIGVENFDDVALDLLMYQNSSVVQSVLNVIVAHHTSQSILLNNLEKVQLLTSKHRELQFKTIQSMLLELERNAETHELWGALDSENDALQSRRTFEIIDVLLNMVRSMRTVLMFDQKFQPEKDIQDAMRHLGFVGIAEKLLQLMASVEEEDLEDADSASTNTLHLVQRCNELFYWFFFQNSDNQELGFLCLNLFLESIEQNTNSHRVIESIFMNNEALVRRCPRTLIEEFVDKICKHGRKHIYLSLLKATNHDGSKGILENQFEIVKHLISPSRIKKTVIYCCPVDQPEFANKLKDMRPYLNAKDVTIDELPEALAYHLEFLEVLSGCTVGKMNISTVEAKVQSVFYFQDLLQAMLHPEALLLSKIKLGHYFYEAMIDVEMMIPGLSQSSVLWRLLFESVDEISEIIEDLQAIEDIGVEAHQFSRQKIEYGVTLISIVQGFFSRYYDASHLTLVDNDPDSEPLNLTSESIRELILRLAITLREINTIGSSYLPNDTKEQIREAIFILDKSSGKFDTRDVDGLVMSGVDNEIRSSKSRDSAKLASTENTVDEADANANEIKDGDLDPIVASLEIFLKKLKESAETMTSIKEQCFDFIAKIEELPSEKDGEAAGEIRLEPLISKLVVHVRELMTATEDERRLDPGSVDTTVWMITAFRSMIERKWGMSIDERDDDGGEEQDIASEDIVNTFNNCGVTALCLDLMSEGVLPELMFEAVKLCVAMLFREGGCLSVQATIFEYLTSNNSELFFKQLRSSIQRLISWHKWNENIIVAEGGDVELPGDIIFLRFMQLTCEGHYLNNQNVLREQKTNATSVNLIDDLVQYLNIASRIPCRTSTNAAGRVASTILEIIQGPCEGNQEYMVLNTELVETLNRIMRSKVVKDCVEEEETELKKCAIDILQGLLEGQGKKQAVYERVLSVIHLDSIYLASRPPVLLETDPPDDPSDEMLVLRSECLVLLQMLAAYRPSILEELGNLDEEGGGSHTASVEVIWRGELQRRFYHVPKICDDLSKASRAKVVEAVDRSNTENKLLDFLDWSRLLYREIKHEQVLKEWRINFFFSQQNVSRITWFQFAICSIINLLMWMYYSFRNGRASLPDGIDQTVQYLAYFLVAVSSITLLSVLIVRGPIAYQGHQEQGSSRMICWSSVASDPLTIYYIGYLIFAVLGAFHDYLYLTFLLLDIIKKNSLTRDILNSVVYPRRQIALTCLLIAFVCYIFSFIYVSTSLCSGEI